MEIGWEQQTAVEALFQEAGVYEQIEIIADYAGRPRVARACLAEACSRITSYNVCYTKLLRLPVVEGGRPGIVHRLDKDTSGIMLVAKNEFALRALMADFKDRRIRKTSYNFV